MTEEIKPPKKSARVAPLSEPVAEPVVEPIVYVGPSLRKYGLSTGVVYKGLPDFVEGMRAQLPVLMNLFVSPAELGKALARLDQPGDNAIKAAYAAAAKTFGGA